MQQRMRAVVAGLAAVLILGASLPALADPIDKDKLKLGITLNETVQTFGQPLRIEWVNTKGQAVLFLFYEGEACILCLEVFTGQDVIPQEDGRAFFPLGFIVDSLSGWGRRYYEQVKLPTE
jgi:hypothetical protein